MQDNDGGLLLPADGSEAIEQTLHIYAQRNLQLDRCCARRVCREVQNAADFAPKPPTALGACVSRAIAYDFLVPYT